MEVVSRKMKAVHTNNNNKHTSRSKKVPKNAEDVANIMMLKIVGIKMQYVINVMKKIT